MMIFLFLQITTDAEGGLKIRAHLRPDFMLYSFSVIKPPALRNIINIRRFAERVGKSPYVYDVGLSRRS